MKFVAALVLALAAWPATAATPWAVDAAASSLTFTAVQAGGKFTGRFMRFDAEIVFDDLDLPGSRFAVRIATGSADTYDEQRDTILRGPDFFWSDAHPQALFVADEFSPSDGGWTAAGSLTLRGVTRRVPLQFRFSRQPNGGARLEGSATIRRLDFGIGQGEWSGTKWVGDPVKVGFILILKPAAVASAP